MIHPADDKRGGEDRREAISHEAIFNKLLEHDDKILSQATAVTDIQVDVKEIKDDLAPIVKGVNSLVWIGRAIVFVGAVAAAIVGIDAASHLFGAHQVMDSVSALPIE